jgi:glutamate racemase
MSRIGIIDWGIGGIGIFQLLQARAKEADLVYFSDTGFTPYGRTTRTELIARLTHVLRFLAGRGVTNVVIGCNAASTVADALKIDDIAITGMIEPAIAFAASTRPRRLGLIGGRRTVLSGAYRRGLAQHGISLEQRIAQPLSAIIETGKMESAEFRSQARRILRPLAACSHILLACTHYPAAAEVLSEFVSPDTRFLDPAEAVVKAIPSSGLGKGSGKVEVLTTGDPHAMSVAAKAAWGISLREPQQVRL